MEDEAQAQVEEEAAKVTTVAGDILGTFFEELAKTDGLQDVASNLRKLVLDDGVFAETAIRAALFPEV